MSIRAWYVPLLAVICAVAARESLGVDPSPPIGSIELPQVNVSSSVNSRDLFGLSERQSGGECLAATGAQFGCAPNKCCNGQPYMGCCYPDQNCLTINGNHACCPTNFQTCGNTMCTYANSTCCANTPGMACGPSQNCCGEGCCDSGYSCCTGSGGTKCCDNFDSQCCGGVCCPTSRDCCGDVCCDAGWTCETRGRCVRKTTARVTFTTTTTSLVRTISTDAAALGKKIGESLGVVGGLLAAGFL